MGHTLHSYGFERSCLASEPDVADYIQQVAKQRLPASITWIALPACGALVPHLIETPCNAFISTSVAQASRAICDILATNVGIVRKSGSQKQTADNVRRVAVSSISAMPRFAGGKPRSTPLSSSRLTSGGDLLALVLEI
jgi:hypothetical protein